MELTQTWVSANFSSTGNELKNNRKEKACKPFVALCTTCTVIPRRQSTKPKKLSRLIWSPPNSVASERTQTSWKTTSKSTELEDSVTSNCLVLSKLVEGEERDTDDSRFMSGSWGLNGSHYILVKLYIQLIILYLLFGPFQSCMSHIEWFLFPCNCMHSTQTFAHVHVHFQFYWTYRAWTYNEKGHTNDALQSWNRRLMYERDVHIVLKCITCMTSSAFSSHITHWAFSFTPRKITQIQRT